MRSTVAIFAQREDVHSERLCTEIQSLGAKAFRVDVENIVDLRPTFSADTFLYSYLGQITPFAEIESTFVRRRPNSRDFRIEDRSETATPREYIVLQEEMLFQDSLFTLERTSRFYNSFGASVGYLGKLNQDEIARSVGLSVAPTMAGGSNEQIISFIESCWARGAQVCTKPLAQKNILENGSLLTRYTEILDRNTKLADEDFESCPMILQEYIEKEYELRVTVIDSKVMPVRIDSQSAPGGTQTDWRKYNVPRTPHSVYTLPDDVSQKLLNFHKLTGLRFSAFDLIRTRNGEYLFLESNPSGQWLWLETLTGYPLTKEIAATLVS